MEKEIFTNLNGDERKTAAGGQTFRTVAGGKEAGSPESRRHARRRRINQERILEGLQGEQGYEKSAPADAETLSSAGHERAAGYDISTDRERSGGRDLSADHERSGGREKSTDPGTAVGHERSGGRLRRKTTSGNGGGAGTPGGPGKSKKAASGFTRLLALLAVMLVIGMIAGALGAKLVGYLTREKKQEPEISVITPEMERLEGIRKAFSQGTSVIQILRKYYPDDLVVYDEGKYDFTPIDRNLKMHSFSSDKVRKNTDGTWGYVDGDLEVMKGIDVSSHQGEIDWEAVSRTNIQFAMIRALYRGYETGNLVEDKTFRTNLENAQANGIKTGVYIFTQAVSTQEVDEEVNMLMGLLGAYDLDLPVVVDVEDIIGEDDRMDNLTKAERTELTKYYCERLEKEGFTPMIYYNLHGGAVLLDLAGVEDYAKWFAVYDSDFYFPYAYQMWQYSETGQVDGITGNVDLDLYFPGLMEGT